MSRATVCASHYYGAANKKHRCIWCGFERGGLAARLALKPKRRPKAVPPKTDLRASVYLRDLGWSLALLGRDRPERGA